LDADDREPLWDERHHRDGPRDLRTLEHVARRRSRFLIAPWVGSDGLKAAFGPKAACGCDQVHDAETETDEVVRAIKKNDGPIAQNAWGCPFVTGRDPDRESLDEDHEEALVAVENLTGVRCSTCPNFYARMPWVREAIAASRWRDKGVIRERVGWPTETLVKALDLVDRGDSLRTRDEYERAEQKREAAADEAKRARENGGRT
jgi:hypothetical protein